MAFIARFKTRGQMVGLARLKDEPRRADYGDADKLWGLRDVSIYRMYCLAIHDAVGRNGDSSSHGE
jgi:hypothetical protein